MTEEVDRKLNMSLDALIKKRRANTDIKKSTQHKPDPQKRPYNRHLGDANDTGQKFARNNHNQSFPGQGNRFGRPQHYRTDTGLIMPNLGAPFGNLPQFQQHMGLPAGMEHGGDMRGMPFPPALMQPGLNPHAIPFMPPPNFEPPPAPIAVPQARREPVSGEVRVSFKKQDIVRVSKDGTITIDTKGVRGASVFMALNTILNLVKVSLSRPKDAKPDDEWSISDGRSLSRFRDGMTIPGRGYEAAQRGKTILDAFGDVDPSAAAAATAASTAAARAAGIFLPGANGHPEQGPYLGLHGRHPPYGHQAPQNGPSSYRPRLKRNSFHRNEALEQNGSAEPSGVKDRAETAQDHDRIRRLAAKGRLLPK